MDARPVSLITLVVGCALLVVAVGLYATELSRAAAVWITPLGIGLLAAGAWTYLTGRWDPRWAWLVLGVVAVALIALGVWTWIYSAQHPPMGV